MDTANANKDIQSVALGLPRPSLQPRHQVSQHAHHTSRQEKQEEIPPNQFRNTRKSMKNGFTALEITNGLASAARTPGGQETTWILSEPATKMSKHWEEVGPASQSEAWDLQSQQGLPFFLLPCLAQGWHKSPYGQTTKNHVLQSVVFSFFPSSLPQRGDIEARMGRPRTKHTF